MTFPIKKRINTELLVDRSFIYKREINKWINKILGNLEEDKSETSRKVKQEWEWKNGSLSEKTLSLKSEKYCRAKNGEF